MKRLFEIGYTRDGNSNVVYREHVAVPFTTEYTIDVNVAIKEFNSMHYYAENIRIDYIDQVRTANVISCLNDIVAEWKDGSLVFTGDDACIIEEAINLLTIYSDVEEE